MLATQITDKQTRRNTLKKQAMYRADRDGVARAAQEYGLTEAKLSFWLEHARLEDEITTLAKALI